MLGYAPVKRAVSLSAGQSMTLDFAMSAQAVSLSEIVVTGYGKQSAGNITGAVTQVSTEEFNTGRIISPAQLIREQGRRASRSSTTTSRAAALSLRIRGATSVNASSEPLYVIDGVPIGTAPAADSPRARNAAQLPEPRRHREHHRPAGRLGRRDLRRERGERRRADHDQVADRAAGSSDRRSSTPAACRRRRSTRLPDDAERRAVPGGGAAVRAAERQPARQREHRLVRPDRPHRRSARSTTSR